jgi:hypothetical protein
VWTAKYPNFTLILDMNEDLTKSALKKVNPKKPVFRFNFLCTFSELLPSDLKAS